LFLILLPEPYDVLASWQVEIKARLASSTAAITPDSRIDMHCRTLKGRPCVRAVCPPFAFVLLLRTASTCAR